VCVCVASAACMISENKISFSLSLKLLDFTF
jgi:hypothetical protein